MQTFRLDDIFHALKMIVRVNACLSMAVYVFFFLPSHQCVKTGNVMLVLLTNADGLRNGDGNGEEKKKNLPHGTISNLSSVSERGSKCRIRIG